MANHFAQGDGVNYPDGPLGGSGSGGGGGGGGGGEGNYSIAGAWTSNWGTPRSNYVISNRTIKIADGNGDPDGNTAGDGFEIDRYFDLRLGVSTNPDFGDPIYLHTEMALIGNDTGVFDMGTAYYYDSDKTYTTADVLVAKFGIERATSGDDAKFYAQIGDTANRAYSLSGSVMPADNTPYALTSRIDFREVGASWEGRLTVWANAKYSDYTSATPTDRLVAQTAWVDLGSQNYLGNRLTLETTTNGAPAASNKRYDDIHISHSFANANFTQVDIGTDSQTDVLQDGHYNWDVVENSSGPDDGLSWSIGYDQIGDFWEGDLSIHVEKLETAGSITAVDELLANRDGVAGELRQDGIAVVGGFRLRLQNLAADPWLFKTYHHLDDGSGSDFQIWIQDAFDQTLTQFSDTISHTFGDEATNYTTLVHSNGEDDVYIYFRPVEWNGSAWVNDPDGVVALNGIKFVPEPGAALLMLVGLAAAASLLRRRRR